MPIRPENKGRYPANWPAISKQVRKDAGNRCEWCKAPNGEIVGRGEGIHKGTYLECDGTVRCENTGRKLGRAKGSEYNGRLVRVVLTVAHLDHQPENCDRSNLRALCQQCHNRYDAPMRAAGRKKRKEISEGIQRLAMGEQNG